MAIKGEKTMQMEDFLERILPFTSWAPYDIQRWAKTSADEGNDYQCIVRDIVFTIPKESVLKYLEEHGEDKSFDPNNEFDSAFKAAMEGTELPKRKPGRPRKSFPGEPLPEELK